MNDAEIFEEWYPALRRFAAVVGGPTTEPDDLVQEALARTLSQTTLAELDDPIVYLRRVVARLASNDRRSTGRRTAILARLRPPPRLAKDSYASDVSELFDLPPQQRAVLYLHLIEGATHDEVGHMLGITPEASRARLSRGLKQLRITLDGERNRP